MAKKKKGAAKKSKAKAGRKKKVSSKKKVKITARDLTSGSRKPKKMDTKPKDDPGGYSDIAHDDVVLKDDRQY